MVEPMRLEISILSVSIGTTPKNSPSERHEVEATPRAFQATSNDEDAGPAEVVVAAIIDSTAEVAVNFISDMKAALLEDCMATAFKNCDADMEQLTADVDALKGGCHAIKQFYVNSLNTAATKIHLDDMTPELKKWLIGDREEFLY